MGLLWTQHLLAVDNVIFVGESKDFVKVHFFENSSGEVTRAQNMEDFQIIFPHKIDCSVCQFASNSYK